MDLVAAHFALATRYAGAYAEGVVVAGGLAGTGGSGALGMAVVGT